MKNFILIPTNEQFPELTYIVEPITRDWHLNCNNFKGTREECVEEGERRKAKAIERIKRRQAYCEPHYVNAPYGSIYDY